MKCRRARHLLFDFVDGLGDEVLRAELDRHLGVCRECEQFAGELKGSLALIKHAPMLPLDETFNWKVRLAIHRERNGVRSRAASSSGWVRGWNLRYAVGAGVAFVAVLAAGVAIVPDRPGPAVELQLQARQQDQGVDARRPTPVTTRTGATAPGPGAGTLVSEGGHMTSPQSTLVGPIDPSTQEAAVDSVVSSHLSQLSPEAQLRCLQRLMERHDLRPRSQQGTPARP